MAKSRQAPAAGRRRPDDDDDDDTPRRRGRDDDDDDEDDGPVKPRKKKASAAGPVRKVLYIVGGVVLAIALFVLIYWVYSPVGTDSSMLCYFPPETVNLTGYDCEEVAKNPAMADVHSAIVGVYKRFGDERWGNTGLSEKDVHRYLSGQAAGIPDEEKDLTPQERRGSITVVKFKQAVEREKFESLSGSYTAVPRESRDGKKYHQLMRKVIVRGADGNHEEEQDDVSFFFPDGRTLVYTTTRRECEECLKRVPGKVVLKDDMLVLSKEVDGHFFRANTGFIPLAAPAPGGGGGAGAASPFGLGIVDEQTRNEYSTGGGIVGSANWFASNGGGGHFLYGELKLFTDNRTAKAQRGALEDSFRKAQAQIYQNEGGSATGLDDPFNPKPPPGKQEQTYGSGNAEERKAILAALNEFVLTSEVRRRGKAVIIQGRISHGTPEQGTFELFWKAVQNKVIPQPPQNFGGGFGPGMGPGGMPGPGR